MNLCSSRSSPGKHACAQLDSPWATCERASIRHDPTRRLGQGHSRFGYPPGHDSLRSSRVDSGASRASFSSANRCMEECTRRNHNATVGRGAIASGYQSCGAFRLLVQRCCVGCSVDDMEDRSELRSRALARNKRDLTAVTEIPAASATSLLDL